MMTLRFLFGITFLLFIHDGSTSAFVPLSVPSSLLPHHHRQSNRLNQNGHYLTIQLASSKKSTDIPVTVLGGTGFVGSRVCQLLVQNGCSVTSLSQSGQIPRWCRDQDWTNSVDWKQVNLVSSLPKELDAAMGKPVAVVSCVGVVGTDPAELLAGNGQANVAAFESAKRSGTVQRVVLVSVSSEVVASASWLPDVFASYFEGKEQAEVAAQQVCNDVTIVKPTFIYGGDSFGLFPPRVNQAYGALIDQLLSASLIQMLADVTPGLIKVALRPPVAVEAVAGACVAGALGNVTGVLNSAQEINTAAQQPPSTGLTDAIEWSIEVTTKLMEWISARVKEQAMKP